MYEEDSYTFLFISVSICHLYLYVSICFCIYHRVIRIGRSEDHPVQPHHQGRIHQFGYCTMRGWYRRQWNASSADSTCAGILQIPGHRYREMALCWKVSSLAPRYTDCTREGAKDFQPCRFNGVRKQTQLYGRTQKPLRRRWSRIEKHQHPH